MSKCNTCTYTDDMAGPVAAIAGIAFGLFLSPLFALFVTLGALLCTLGTYFILARNVRRAAIHATTPAFVASVGAPFLIFMWIAVALPL